MKALGLVLSMSVLLVAFQNCDLQMTVKTATACPVATASAGAPQIMPSSSSGDSQSECVTRVPTDPQPQVLVLDSVPWEKVVNLTYQRSGFYPAPNQPNSYGVTLRLIHYCDDMVIEPQAINSTALTDDVSGLSMAAPCPARSNLSYNELLYNMQRAYPLGPVEHLPVGADMGTATLELLMSDNTRLTYYFETSDDVRGKVILRNASALEAQLSKIARSQVGSL